MRPIVQARRRPSRAACLRAAVLVALAAVALVGAAGCRNVLSREYEYEEDVHLSLDGSATVYVNASVPALVALRGAALPTDPSARLDREAVRTFFESPVARVRSVSTSRREGRRYVHVRLDVPDVQRLHEAPAFAWSRYALQRRDRVVVYTQALGAASGTAAPAAGWDGDELVAIRLHLPSRVPFHNAPSKTIERGNIIVWEQALSARQSGTPVAIEVHLEPASILANTLALFGAMIVLALGALGLFVWWTSRRGRTTAPAGPATA